MRLVNECGGVSRSGSWVRLGGAARRAVGSLGNERGRWLVPLVAGIPWCEVKDGRGELDSDRTTELEILGCRAGEWSGLAPDSGRPKPPRPTRLRAVAEGQQSSPLGDG